MMMGRRRFVNLVAEGAVNMVRVLSVHRLNVSEHLFYPTTADAEKARPVVSTLDVLPPPAASFQPISERFRTGQVFALLSPRRSNESRLIWSNPEKSAVLYDLESHSAYPMPILSDKGYDPITISIASPHAPEEDDLYVMTTGFDGGTGGFQVLKSGGRPSNGSKVNLPEEEAWLLESLPMPPLPYGEIIRSHAVLHDGRTICVTTAPAVVADDYDTDDTSSFYSYLFATVQRAWRLAPDGWNLPFYRGAEHVPDLKLWLGFCNGGRHLCASSDLSAVLDEGKPPTLEHQWEIVKIPEEWVPGRVSLINLGDGRFCIFRVLYDVPEGWDLFDEYQDFARKRLALLTGVEIISSPVEHGDLRMVAHKSLSYIFDDERIRWVL